MITPVGLSAQSTGAVTTEANGRLGKNDFLQMLVTQMKMQDPLNPMDNSQMAAQMAQFSQLEQMLNMTQAFSTMSAVAMLGRNIKSTATDGSLITGQVISVRPTTDGVPILTLADGSVVAFKDVQEVVF